MFDFTDKLIPRHQAGPFMYFPQLVQFPCVMFIHDCFNIANEPKLAPLSTALAVMYLTVFVIEVFGLISTYMVSH